MPGLHKSLVSSSLASVVLHGALIAGFSFNIGSELTRDAGDTKLNIQLISVNVAQESAIELPATIEAVSVTNSQPTPEPAISSKKPAKEKVSKIENIPKPVKTRTEVQGKAEAYQQSDASDKAEASEENEHEAVEDASPASFSETVNKADPIKRWLSELQQRINRHRRYPRQAIKRGLEGDVRVQAVINPDGTLANAEVLSGHRIFHGDSLRSLKNALPFLPPAGTIQPVTMIFTIHYKLD